MKIGSLCSGYGGLEEGVRSVVGGEVVWQSDIDAGACKILAHRYPGIPNIGDMTTVDWSKVEPVDVITGGTPCQDVSAAGKRAGMRAGTRSGLWSSMCDAIDIIRPSLVVWENVRGVLSAHADSAVEPCPICVGDERDAHLRALGRVVGDLAELGYVGRWTGLRAADVGAPHGRYRVFVAAWPVGDTDGMARSAGLAQRGGRRALGEPGAVEGVVGSDRPSAAHAHGDALREQPVAITGRCGATVTGLPGADAAAHADRDGLGRLEELHGSTGAERQSRSHGHDADRLAVAAGGVDWGAYGPAVHRWERTLGRLAPPPTERGKNGQPRLSPAFVEWLMGLPAGWVTDVPGITRNEALKALGNGVVPQQAAAALRLLLPDVNEVAA